MRSIKVLNSPQTKNIKYISLILVLILGLGGVYIYSNSNWKRIGNTQTNYVEVQKFEQSIDDIPRSSEFEKRIRRVNWSGIKAKSVYAFNPETGKIYYQRNINQQLPIASITKIATVLTAKNLYEDTEILKISSALPKMDNPLGLRVGDTISLNNLYKCSLIASKNDCANAIAYVYGYDQFISQMNNLANGYGLKNTKFSNPTGYINDGNYSTAYDLGVIASVFVRNSDLVKITDMPNATVKYSRGDVRISSTNVMLAENKNIKGLKTGFTYASGECLVLYYDYGNDEKLITIVLNSPSRFAESRNIFNNVVSEFNP